MRERCDGIGSTTLGELVARGILATLLAISTGCGVPGESPPPAASTGGNRSGPSTHEKSTGEGHGRQAILEEAKRRGALFWGAGNEPGWNFEIGPAQTIVVAQYGNERHEFATPQPVADRQNRRTTYQTRFDGHEIVIEITYETCSDTMSDETFPVRVRIELDGRELRGCGVSLARIDR